ncbi:MAG: DUF86 domain-containing protein [Cardiobacteriaceae bacterium]|nr:DUF86 domain-containing protein [Cardiobacteriaceae bacterium]
MTPDAAPIVALLRDRVPDLLAVYAFGSRINGTANAASDLDLAVLVAGYADPLQLFALAGEVADIAGCEVDLLDLRAASTVMQAQVLQGERWWAKDVSAGLFEAMVLSEKAELDECYVTEEASVDDVLRSKKAIIEYCVARAREEYAASDDFAHDYTRQDAALFNVQRACDAAIDMGKHLLRREKLGIPQGSRDVFTLLEQAGWLDAALADVLKRMVGFRNIAVHNYQALEMPIVEAVITRHLDDFLQFSERVLMRDLR